MLGYQRTGRSWRAINERRGQVARTNICAAGFLPINAGRDEDVTLLSNVGNLVRKVGFGMKHGDGTGGLTHDNKEESCEVRKHACRMAVGLLTCDREREFVHDITGECTKNKIKIFATDQVYDPKFFPLWEKVALDGELYQGSGMGGMIVFTMVDQIS